MNLYLTCLQCFLRSRKRLSHKDRFIYNDCQETYISIMLSALKACSKLKDLEMGKTIHMHAIEYGTHFTIAISSSLLSMYAKCGDTTYARSVFDRMDRHDVISWTALISGYVEYGEDHHALKLFASMQLEGYSPNERTFTSVIKACTGLLQCQRYKSIKGRDCYLQAVNSGYGDDIFVASSAVEMFAKSGNMVDAQAVFNNIACPDTVLWTTLMLGYVENGQEEIAFDIFSRGNSYMNARSYTVVLKACTGLAAKEEGDNVKLVSLGKGMKIHSQVLHKGFEEEIFVSSSLIEMYVKCGSLFDGRMVFDRMKTHNVVSWNSLMLGYVENGEEELALELFESYGLKPDGRTFVAALKACGSLATKQGHSKLRYVEKARDIHRQAVETDIYVESALVDTYAKCGYMYDARRVYDGMYTHDVISWTVLVMGYVGIGEEEMGLEAYYGLRPRGSVPDGRAFVAVLKACVGTAKREKGREVGGMLVKMGSLGNGMGIHGEVMKCSCEKDVFVWNTLMDMYASCGSLEDARRVFDQMQWHTIVSWTVLIQGYVENGYAELGLEVFTCMRVQPDVQAVVAALKACSCLAMKESSTKTDGKLVKVEAMKKGMEIHSLASENLLESDFHVGNALIEMYGSCGSLREAKAVFDGMPSRNLVSWNTLLSAYTENGEGKLALDLMEDLKEDESVVADSQSYMAALKACGHLSCLETGISLHADISRHGHGNDVVVIACLIDFYGKCGSLGRTQELFDSAKWCFADGLVIWNSLIAAYSRVGEAHEVFRLLHIMQEQGIEPDRITLGLVLTSCSHAGLVEEGKRFFDLISPKYGLKPDMDHYHCIVDLLARVKLVEDAVNVLENMPFPASSLSWRTVLGACVKWQNVELGRRAFDELIKLDGGDSAAYLLMSNLYGT